MWWKIYFFIILIFSIFGSFIVLEAAPLGFVDFLDLTSSIIIILALYSYIYKKQILKNENWRIIFWILIIYTALDLINIFFLPKDLITKIFPFLLRSVEYNPNDFLLGAIVGIPAYYALYQIGFINQNKSKK